MGHRSGGERPHPGGIPLEMTAVEGRVAEVVNKIERAGRGSRPLIVLPSWSRRSRTFAWITAGGRSHISIGERSNLFLIPLDSTRAWYRYHHLFRELLQHELEHTIPTEVGELHRRASAWHARHGSISSSIRHAIAGGDAGRASKLITDHWYGYLQRGPAWARSITGSAPPSGPWRTPRRVPSAPWSSRERPASVRSTVTWLET
jgi:hypothetical protein